MCLRRFQYSLYLSLIFPRQGKAACHWVWSGYEGIASPPHTEKDLRDPDPRAPRAQGPDQALPRSFFVFPRQDPCSPRPLVRKTRARTGTRAWRPALGGQAKPK